MLMAIVEEAASPRRYSFCNLTVWIDITTSKVSTTTRRPTIPEIFSESRRLSMNARQSRNSLRILPIMANARMACGDETPCVYAGGHYQKFNCASVFIRNFVYVHGRWP